jgi:hypothetical protein
MRVLIGTPCGGGVVHTQYMTSVLTTMNNAQRHKEAVSQQALRQLQSQLPAGLSNEEIVQRIQAPMHEILYRQTVDVGIFTLVGESLLQRGRNHIAQLSMMQGWDKLFFIDSDQSWTWEQFLKIAFSNQPIACGVVPLKNYPISLNYLPFREDEKHYKDAIRDPEALMRHKAANGGPEIKVPFIGTAFMCIETKVFRHLCEFVPSYQYPSPQTSLLETHWDFFSCKPIKESYLSEDWSFCHLARSKGIDVVINADVIINHTGNWTFQPGQHLTFKDWKEVENVASSNEGQAPEARKLPEEPKQHEDVNLSVVDHRRRGPFKEQNPVYQSL